MADRRANVRMMSAFCRWCWDCSMLPPSPPCSAARLQRAERYARALKQIGREASHEFCKRLTFMTLIASLLFALCLPILLTDFYRATFKFFCVVYGFLLVVHLVRIAIAQNISIARAND